MWSFMDLMRNFKWASINIEASPIHNGTLCPDNDEVDTLIRIDKDWVQGDYRLQCTLYTPC